mgnify:CR=1 FL=1
MRHATANRPSGARRPLAAAIAVAVITAAPVAAVGVNDRDIGLATEWAVRGRCIA